MKHHARTRKNVDMSVNTIYQNIIVDDIVDNDFRSFIDNLAWVLFTQSQ